MTIDNDDPPKNKWRFEDLKPGDSFYFEGVSSATVSSAFGRHMIRGKYTIKREGDGFRFHLLDDTKRR